MPGPEPPPKTLAAAEEQFRIFLAANGFPSKITWLSAQRFLIDRRGHRWVRRCSGTKEMEEASQLYALGLKRNEGIAMRVECSTATETFATIYIPADADDAQYRLIGRCLKCTAPVERPQCSVIENAITWFFLNLRNRERTRGYIDDWW